MKAIVTETKRLIRKESELVARIIENLQKIQDQKIHIEMGYDSLFTFCREELGMPEASISRKLQCLKVVNQVPQVLQDMKEGELSEAKVNEIGIHISRENRARPQKVGKRETKSLVEKVKAAPNANDVRKALAEESTAPSPTTTRETEKHLAGGRRRLEIEVDEELMELIDWAKSHHSHISRGKLKEVLKLIIRDHRKRVDPQFKKSPSARTQPELLPRGSEGAQDPCNHEEKPNSSTQRRNSDSKGKRSRYIPKSLREQVMRRDQGRCSYIQEGKRCQSKFQLQVHHIKPYARGGGHTLENLAALCGVHNRFEAEKEGLLRGA